MRDANKWSHYLMESLSRYGDEAQVVFQAHNWPHWGNAYIKDYIINTALIYQFIHDQSLLYINQGLTENEVAHAIQLVFANPKNQEARNLCADALEQLAYQAESGTWRNVYLSGAKDLREGSKMDNQYSYKGKSLSPAEALR